MVIKMDCLRNPNVTYVYGGLFTTDGVWRHPDRTEVTYELIFVTSGSVCLTVENDGEYTLDTNDLIVLEPGVRHFGHDDTDHVSFYWIHFSLAEGAALPFTTRVFRHFACGYEFKELLHRANLGDGSENLVGASLSVLLAQLEYTERSDRPTEGKTAAAIYEWLRINASASLKVSDAAKHFGVSADHLSRLLQHSFGKSAKRIMDDFVLAKCRERLCRTGQYNKEIADALGFADAAAFIHFFTYHEGVSPAVFRKRYYLTHLNNH